MEYRTIKEKANEWGLSEKRVQVLCRGGRIEGAVRFGRIWAIPEGAEKPGDNRVRTGQYINWRDKYSSTAIYGQQAGLRQSGD